VNATERKLCWRHSNPSTFSTFKKGGAKPTNPPLKKVEPNLPYPFFGSKVDLAQPFSKVDDKL
jgi:hypothetical protein